MRPVFDANIFITYKNQLTDEDYDAMALSMVVLYELTARVMDKTEWQYHEKLRKRYDEDGLLLVPTMSDWWETAKLIARVRYHAQKGYYKTSQKLPDAQRLQNDALIARAAYLKKFYVVTENTKDFELFMPFLNVQIVSANEYFGL
jgi:predicted nucleic acid-binding protein